MKYFFRYFQRLLNLVLLQRHRSKVAQAAKPADEANPRPVRKKTNTRRRAASKAGLAACATKGLTQGQSLRAA
jgi:hypothetical protein